jgi:hypothetical protein
MIERILELRAINVTLGKENMTMKRSSLRPVGLGGLTILGLSMTLVSYRGLATAQAPNTEDQNERLEVQRSQVQKIVEPLLAHLDTIKRLEQKLDEAKLSTSHALATVKDAETTVSVAKIAVQEYLQGTYPSEVQIADREIALANSDLARAKDRKEWADRMLAKGSISEAEHLADVFALQRAEFGLKQATTKRQVLAKYSMEKELRRLQGHVQKAEEELRLTKADVSQGTDTAAVDQREIRAESLSAQEVRVLVLISEAGKLQVQRQFDQAQAKITEAATIARAEEARRSELRYSQLLRRIDGAIDQLQKPGEPR